MNKIMSIGLLASSALLSQVAVSQDTLTKPDVPTVLATPATQNLKLIAYAKGVQIYTCTPNKTDPTKFDWLFKAPEADLFTAQGAPIGKHYAGPSWESNDGSKVVGQLKASDKAPDSNAIAWLLLTSKTNQGTGIFAHTVSIQRLNTAGGKAPVDGCSASETGKELRVPYTAQYYFYD
jgi:hypothetical protein